MEAKGTEVGTDGTREESGLLRDDGEGGAEVPQSKLADVFAVDQDGATTRFNDPRGVREGRGRGGGGEGEGEGEGGGTSRGQA
jgi:hypothetical protein